MSKPSVSSINIIKVNNNEQQHTVDLLAVEEPLEIRIGYGPADNREQKNISVTMRTPGNDFELALGFLLTEGIITTASDIYKIQYCTELNSLDNKENILRVELNPGVEIDMSKLQRNFYTTSSCGVCGKESIEAVKTNCKVVDNDPSVVIDSFILVSLPDILRKQQNVFEYTGGLHACALFDLQGNLILLREDVGRHNALDKLIGATCHAVPKATGMTEALALHKSILLLSGRASFELLQKAAMAGIPIVCAVGAPSSLAVECAESFGITLVGFLRDKRFNIYSNAQRIAFLMVK